MTLYGAYKYLIDMNDMYSEHVMEKAAGHIGFLWGLLILGIICSIIGYALLTDSHNSLGAVFFIFIAIICIFSSVTMLYGEKKEREKFSMADYEDIYKEFNNNLHEQMVSPESKEDAKEIKYQDYNIIERIGESGSNLFDVVIKTKDGNLIKRVKVVYTDNANLIGVYRELPDKLDLSLKPFTEYEGYLFIKDVKVTQ